MCVRACERGFVCVAVVAVVVRLFFGGGAGWGVRDLSFFLGSRYHTNCDKKYGVLLTIEIGQLWKLKIK